VYVLATITVAASLYSNSHLFDLAGISFIGMKIHLVHPRGSEITVSV